MQYIEKEINRLKVMLTGVSTPQLKQPYTIRL